MRVAKKMTHQTNTVPESRSTTVGSILTKRGSPKSIKTALFSTTMDLYKEQVSFQMESHNKEEQLDSGEATSTYDKGSQIPLQEEIELVNMFYQTEIKQESTFSNHSFKGDTIKNGDKLVDSEPRLVEKETFSSAEMSETSIEMKQGKAVNASERPMIQGSTLEQSTLTLKSTLEVDDGQSKETEIRLVKFDRQLSEPVVLNKSDGIMLITEDDAPQLNRDVNQLIEQVVDEGAQKASANMIEKQGEELLSKQENSKQQEIQIENLKQENSKQQGIQKENEKQQDFEKTSLKQVTPDVGSKRPIDEKAFNSNGGLVEEAGGEDVRSFHMEKHPLTEEYVQKELSQSGTPRQPPTVTPESTKKEDDIHTGERYVVDKQVADKVGAEAVKRQESNDTLLTRQLLRIIRAAKTTYTADRQQQVLVKLHPESLGRVTIQFMQQGQGFVVKIIAERQTAKESLDRSLHQLRQLSSLQDTKVEVVKVEDDLPDQEKQQERQEEDDQTRKQRLLEAAQKKNTTDFQDWMSTILSRGVKEYDPN